MRTYKIVKKGVFETQLKFEEKVNSFSAQGWKAISISSQGNLLVILMEKER